MKIRRRFKQTVTLEEQLADEAKRLRDEAKKLPPGPEQAELLRKARENEMVSELTAGSHLPDYSRRSEATSADGFRVSESDRP